MQVRQFLGDYSCPSTGDNSVETTATIKANPKINGTQADYDEQYSVLNQIENTLNMKHNGLMTCVLQRLS